jgi:hypothetical protein
MTVSVAPSPMCVSTASMSVPKRTEKFSHPLFKYFYFLNE